MTTDCDLHVHTTASDGALTPSEVVSGALVVGLRALAITDHDTVDGVAEAVSFARGSALTVVRGVELSVDEGGDGDAHVLGLLLDDEDPALLATLQTLRVERDARARAMVELLAQAGHPLDYDSVRAIAGHGSIGRVHIARALLEAGAVSTIEDAFRTLIGRDAPFYVRKRTMGAAEAIAAIHGAGGVAVLAHPGVSGEHALPALIRAGLDGIEAFHAEHTQADRERFAALASRQGLLTTGGSDFHGPGVRSAAIGGGACPGHALEALEERANLYRP